MLKVYINDAGKDWKMLKVYINDAVKDYIFLFVVDQFLFVKNSFYRKKHFVPVSQYCSEILQKEKKMNATNHQQRRKKWTLLILVARFS